MVLQNIVAYNVTERNEMGPHISQLVGLGQSMVESASGEGTLNKGPFPVIKCKKMAQVDLVGSSKRKMTLIIKENEPEKPKSLSPMLLVKNNSETS